MKNSFDNYVETFKLLNEMDKKEEIIKNLKELFDYLKKINNNNISYPIYEDYESDDEFLSVAFTYIISIKELTAISLDKINN